MQASRRTVNTEAGTAGGAGTRRQFSLRDLLVFVSAVAVGFAVPRLSEFGVIDGLFAAAAMLVVVGLLAEICFVLTTLEEESERFARRFHVGWRVMLVIALLFHYVVGTYQGLLKLCGFEPGALDLLESRAASSMMLLQLALFSALTLDLRPTSVNTTPSRLRRCLTWSAMALLVLMLLATNWMVVVMLVHIAVESMELHGPMVQYDQGSVNDGVDPNIQRRFRHFATMSLAGFLALVPLVATLAMTLRRAQRRQLLVRPAALLVVCLVVASVFPAWVYVGGGLRGFSPPLREASLRTSWASIAAAALCVSLLSTLISYRLLGSVQTATRNTSTNRWPLFVHHRMTGLLTVGLASLAWISMSWDREFGFWSFWEMALAPVAEPTRYLAFAIVWIIILRLVDRRPSKNNTGWAPVAVERTSLAITWFSIAITIVVVVPTLMWFVYSTTYALIRW